MLKKKSPVLSIDERGVISMPNKMLTRSRLIFLMCAVCTLAVVVLVQSCGSDSASTTTSGTVSLNMKLNN